MPFQPKKKICSGCGKESFLWRSNPPTCKGCIGKEKQDSLDGIPPKPRKALQTKPKPRINGKPLHTAIYMAAFGYGDTDFIPSEISGDRCQDVHHIEARGMGGSGKDDRIENLMGLTREEHEDYGDKTQYMAYLYEMHGHEMEANGVKFDKKWINEQIKKYS